MTNRAKQFVKDHAQVFVNACVSEFGIGYMNQVVYERWCEDVWSDYQAGKPTLFGRKPGSLPKPRGF